MRLMACNGGSLKKGGSPSTISITIMPVERKNYKIKKEDDDKLSTS